MKGRDLDGYVDKVSGETKEEITALFSEQKMMLAYQLVSDLTRIHQLGFIHRDVKPENAMLDLENLSIRNIDFGLSIRQDQENPKLKGSPRYIHGQSVVAYNQNKSRPLLTHYDNVGLACNLCVVLGWGNPGYARDWGDVDKWSVFEGLPRSLPPSIRERAAAHPALAIIEKLLASGSEGANYYAAENALADIRPFFQASLLNHTLAAVIADLESKIDASHQLPFSDSDKMLRQHLLYSLRDLLCIPKGSSPDFLARRKNDLFKFLSKPSHKKAFERLGYRDLAIAVMSNIVEGSILSSPAGLQKKRLFSVTARYQAGIEQLTQSLQAVLERKLNGLRKKMLSKKLTLQKYEQRMCLMLQELEFKIGSPAHSKKGNSYVSLLEDIQQLMMQDHAAIWANTEKKRDFDLKVLSRLHVLQNHADPDAKKKMDLFLKAYEGLREDVEGERVGGLIHNLRGAFEKGEDAQQYVVALSEYLNRKSAPNQFHLQFLKEVQGIIKQTLQTLLRDHLTQFSDSKGSSKAQEDSVEIIQKVALLLSQVERDAAIKNEDLQQQLVEFNKMIPQGQRI